MSSFHKLQPDWELPWGYILRCETNAECPHTLTCHPENKVCTGPLHPIFENGVVEYEEACDTGEFNTDFKYADNVLELGLVPCQAIIARASWKIPSIDISKSSGQG